MNLRSALPAYETPVRSRISEVSRGHATVKDPLRWVVRKLAALFGVLRDDALELAQLSAKRWYAERSGLQSACRSSSSIYRRSCGASRRPFNKTVSGLMHTAGNTHFLFVSCPVEDVQDLL
jgi:hypothetical protein